ncbi:MAG: aminoacyl-tRNA deacylase [Methylococcales bacterium]
MPAERLKNFLDQQGLKYLSISHSMAFTAVEIAKSSHIQSKEMSKTLVVSIRGEPAITVIPAVQKFDLNILKEALDTEQVELTAEHKFSKLFPDCEAGAMPPFGNPYGMETYVDERVTEQESIAFNAGSHSEVIKMLYHDYERLVAPRFVILAD